ncbi:MAG TPA: HAMP domain-containing sensor histidine kinase [Nitriliruptorales bacterium]|nr:HAMP domain-containing sensor histidine kinase [Nitriliruptorales bacterium]
MRTPSLRRRVTVLGVAAVAVLLLALDAFVYLALRNRLEHTLADVLAARVELARELDAALGPDALAERLQALGVPAIVETTDGRVVRVEPAVPRFQQGPPGPLANVAHPRVSQTVPLDSGGTAEVFATRSGVDATLRRILLLEAIGTGAAIAVAVMLFGRVTRIAMSPLEQVVAAARRTAGGRTGERLRPDDSSTELGRMAAAYDDMLDALERAVAVAQEAEGRTRRFLDDAAHQLRTPIAGIRASVEALLREGQPAERDRLLANLVREVARASRIQNSLLLMARLDRGQPIDARPSDLVELCRDEVERAASLAPTVDVTLRVDAAPDGPMLLDPAEVREALGNLLDNARRHAARRIEVRLAAGDDRVEIAVRDDGPGVPYGKEQLIFERFATLDGKGGSGLGLPIARAVARAHGGDLVLDAGAFVLQLPRAADNRPGWSDPQVTSADARSSASRSPRRSR